MSTAERMWQRSNMIDDFSRRYQIVYRGFIVMIIVDEEKKKLVETSAKVRIYVFVFCYLIDMYIYELG